MNERKTIKHRQYTIEEKNEIVEMYLNGESRGTTQLSKDLDVSRSVIHRWIKQYLTHGTTTDNRGKATKQDNMNKGRPKTKFNYEDMSKEELIEHIRILEDIKKTMAYLKKQK